MAILGSIIRSNPITFYAYSVWYVKWLRRYARKKRLQTIDQLDVKAYKQSDTVFILGSGASINELTTSDWEKVRAADSIGFNYFLVHDHVPTYYFYETPYSSLYFDFFVKTWNTKSALHKTLPLIVQYAHYYKRGYSLKGLKHDSQHTFFNIPHRYSTLNKSKLSKILQRELSGKAGSCDFSRIIHHRGSVSYLIAFAYLAGYKNIVLLGIDMNNHNYFYEEKQEENPLYAELLAVKKAYQDSRQYDTHPMIDKGISKQMYELPLDEYIYLLNKVIFLNEGVNLSVGSESSVLKNGLKTYKF